MGRRWSGHSLFPKDQRQNKVISDWPQCDDPKTLPDDAGVTRNVDNSVVLQGARLAQVQGSDRAQKSPAPERRSHRNMRPSSLPAATAQSPGPTKLTSFMVCRLMWPR